MGLTELLVGYVTQAIAAGGYPLVMFAMVLESMVFPLPSEAVMPFAGFLVAKGEMNFWWVLCASTLGSIVGSWLSYAMGRYGGRAIVDRWGKYLLLNHHHLNVSEKFFAKYGEEMIFVSRFIPVVRHLISIPAGMAEMNIWKFSLFTILGAGAWNAILLWVGMKLEQDWGLLIRYSHYIDIVIVIALIAGVGYFIRARIKHRI